MAYSSLNREGTVHQKINGKLENGIYSTLFDELLSVFLDKFYCLQLGDILGLFNFVLSLQKCSLKMLKMIRLKLQTSVIETLNSATITAIEVVLIQMTTGQNEIVNFFQGRHGKSFKCSQCAQEFDEKLELKSHLEDHAKEKPFACEKCGLSFANQVMSFLKQNDVYYL